MNNVIILALLRLVVIILILVSITAIIIFLIKKKGNTQQSSENTTVIAQRKSKLKINIIISVLILAVFVAGVVVTIVQIKKSDISQYCGTYECQVEQGEALTTYSISIDEPIDLNGVKGYFGTYSARSTNATFSFNYTMEYSIEKENITIKFNQGQTISGTFTNGNLIINSIGSQTNLLFIKIK